MSLTVSAKSGYEPLKPGSYPAICVGVIDLGTQTGSFGSAQKVYLDFNVIADDGKEQAIGSIYTASLSTKAKLREHLEGWRGRPFTADELVGFKLSNLISKPALLHVTNKTNINGDKTRDQIGAITGLPADKTPPAPAESPVIFDLAELDADVYDTLPEWLQKMIAQAPEFELPFKDSPVSTAKPAAAEPTVEDIPF